MAQTSNYFKLFVVGSYETNIAIHKISFDEGIVSFTGAWNLQSGEKNVIHTIISDSHVIYENKNPGLKNPEVDMNSFIKIARTEANNAYKIYNEYKEAEIKKRKNLISPDFYDWPDIDFKNPKLTLKKLGIRDSIPGTEESFENVLSLSRLIKFIGEKWFSDEMQRIERKYMADFYPTIRLVPPGWI